jgi:hypothetical protein
MAKILTKLLYSLLRTVFTENESFGGMYLNEPGIKELTVSDHLS